MSNTTNDLNWIMSNISLKILRSFQITTLVEPLHSKKKVVMLCHLHHSTMIAILWFEFSFDLNMNSEEATVNISQTRGYEKRSKLRENNNLMNNLNKWWTKMMSLSNPISWISILSISLLKKSSSRKICSRTTIS